jgi:hypothetical protein
LEDEYKCRPLLVCLKGSGVVSVRARVEVTVLTKHALAPPETMHAQRGYFLWKNRRKSGLIIMVTIHGGT